MNEGLSTGAKVVLWAIPVVLLALCLLVTASNWSIFISGFISRKKTASIIPFIGGLSGAVGMSILPVEGAGKHAWIPLLFDYGCIPYLALFLYFWFRYERKGAPEVMNEDKFEDSQE